MGKEKYMGKIVNPCSCCEIILELYNENNQKEFEIKGDLCQCGVMCRHYPCDACQKATFKVCDKDGNLLTNLLKKSAGCIKASISDADEFAVLFPQNISVYQKGLLMSAAMLLDYLYYEESPANNNNALGRSGGFNMRMKF